MDMFIVRKCCSVVDTGKIEKNNFLLQNHDFSLRELKCSGNMYFSYTERLTSAKVENVLWLQRNDKKVMIRK